MTKEKSYDVKITIFKTYIFKDIYANNKGDAHRVAVEEISENIDLDDGPWDEKVEINLSKSYLKRKSNEECKRGWELLKSKGIKI